MGYSPRGRKESDTTEQRHFHFVKKKELEEFSPFLLLHIPHNKTALQTLGNALSSSGKLGMEKTTKQRQ